MKKIKLLIATTNDGKFSEMRDFLASMPFDILSLKDAGGAQEAPEESGTTLEENAVLKARYYGRKTGLLTLADDTGLFIDALGGFPGVKSARLAGTSDEQIADVLGKLSDVPKERRTAQFRIGLACFNPSDETVFIGDGVCDGEILEAPVSEGIHIGYGFNRIFFVPSAGKTYAEMTSAEKSGISHRGKALVKIKYFLQNQFRGQHIVVPIALILKDGKLLAAMRNDPHRPDFHGKYEFPGGAVELGEKLEDNLVREVLEETGYKVEIVERLTQIKSDYREEHNYQVYLVPYVCKIISGDGRYDDQEILRIDWFDLDEFADKPKIGKDYDFYKELLPRLKELAA